MKYLHEEGFILLLGLYLLADWGIYWLFEELVPVNIFEEWMGFYLACPFIP